MGYNELLLFLSVLPSIVLGVYIYKKDVVEKEPISLLMKLLGAGVLATVITLAVSYFIDAVLPFTIDEKNLNLVGLFLYYFFYVALIEEGSKYLMVRKFTWNSREFNHIFDAIVYCVFVGLGFATFENILYVFTSSDGLGTALMRAVLSVPGHIFFAIAMGTYYGRSKQASLVNKEETQRKNDFLSIFVPTILHGTFDFCLSANSTILILVYLIFVIFLYVISFKRVSRISKVSNNFYTEEPRVIKLFSHSVPKYCRNCGRLVEGNYCIYCGTKKL